jgi:RNA polymerase sigma-70 factor (ECF subfamily)
VRLKIWSRLGTAADGAPGATQAIDADLALLYEREEPRLRGWLAQRLGPDKAADFAQSAFTRMLGLGPDQRAALQHPRAYLYRVARNLAINHVKSAAVRLERAGTEDEEASDDPHAALEARDMLRRVEAAIAVLPDRSREIFMAHRFEDLTYGQIAERMGISIKTVEKHIGIALRELHRAVKDLP